MRPHLGRKPLTDHQREVLRDVKREQLAYFRAKSAGRVSTFKGHGLGALLELDRALASLRNGIVLPPLVVEIQPGSGKKRKKECSANCPSCIAYFLARNQVGRPAPGAHLYFDGPAGIRNGVTLIEELGDYYRQAGQRGEVKISNSPGDPGQIPDWVSAVARKARGSYAEWIDFMVFTNGLHTTELVERGVHHDLDGMYVSLDGISVPTVLKAKGKRGDASEALVRREMEKMHWLGANRPDGLEFVMGFVITRDNYHEAKAAVEWAKDMGFTQLRLKVDFTMRGMEAHLKEIERLIGELEEEAAKHESPDFKATTPLPLIFTLAPPYWVGDFFGYCLFGLISLTISRWGTVHPCYHTPSSVANPLENNWGDLRKRTVRQILEDPGRLDALLKFPDPEHCDLCPSSSFALSTRAALTRAEDLITHWILLMVLEERLGEKRH